MKLKIILIVIAASLFALAAGAAQAKYPEKSIEVIIPYGAGSNTDTAGRILLNAMREVMGVDFIPLNVAGAGGTVGTTRMAAIKADGYTIGFLPSAPVIIAPHLRPLSYDNTSIEPICLVVDNPTSVTVHPDSPYNTMDDLIAAARAGKSIVAVGGAPGSLPHITQAAIANAYGVTFIYLPAGGGGKAAKAIMSGEATFAADNSSMGKINGLKTLAVAASHRIEGLEEVPTFNELGKDVNVSIFYGLYAPAGTPDDVVDALSRACGKAVATKAFREGMANANYIVRYLGREDFMAFFQKQYAASRDMLSRIKIKLLK